jgi:hypothetical protein
MGKKSVASKLNQKKSHPVLSDRLQNEFIEFLKVSPPKKAKTNLRRMVIDWMILGAGSESIYLPEILLDLNALFELLDIAEEEFK